MLENSVERQTLCISGIEKRCDDFLHLHALKDDGWVFGFHPPAVALRAERVKESARSLWYRAQFSRYHFSRARRLDSTLGNTQREVLRSILGRSVTLETKRIRAIAEYIACAVNIHGVRDNLAFLVAYYLDLPRQHNTEPRNITLPWLLKKLPNEQGFSIMRGHLSKLEEGQFRHLDSIVNHAKHRHFIPIKPLVSLVSDDFGVFFEKIQSDNGEEFARVKTAELLEAEFTRLNRVCINVIGLLEAIPLP